MSLEDFQTPQQLDLIKQISSRYSIAVERIQITGIITGIRAASVQIDLLLLPPHASDPFAPLSSTVAARLVADFASARWDILLFAKQIQPTSPDITSPPAEPTNAPSPAPTRTPVTVIVAPPVREKVDLIVLIEPGVQLLSAGDAVGYSRVLWYSRGAQCELCPGASHARCGMLFGRRLTMQAPLYSNERMPLSSCEASRKRTALRRTASRWSISQKRRGLVCALRTELMALQLYL